MSVWNKRKNSSRLFVCLLAGCMLAGCTPATGGDEELILTEKEAETLTYDMAEVSVSDVKKTEKTRCVYQQVNDESLSFNVSGKRVAKVYVEEGESVVKGQLLAELDTGNAEDQITDLEYNIALNEKNLEYIATNLNNEISALWLKFIYQSGQSEQDREVLDANLENTK